MARPRKPPNPAAQAERARRQAANAASRNASAYWRQQAKPPAATTPGGQGTAPAGPYQAPDGINPVGLSVNGLPPVVPTQYDQWLQSYQPYINVKNATDANRTTQIGQSAKAISDALAMWGGDLSSFQNALNSTLGASALGAAGQQFLNAFDWNAIQNAATNASQGGVSVLAQLQKAQADRQNALENDAVSRGIYRSGETMDSTQRNETQRAQDQYSEQRRLMDYLTGLSSAFAQAENQRGADINAAATGAYDYYRDPANQIPGAYGMQGAVGQGDPTAPPPAPTATGTPADETSPNPAVRREAIRRKRAQAQAAAARARAQAQRRAG